MNVQDFILDPKDAQRILIGANGKLGPMEFAKGLVAIVAVSLALSLLTLFPVIGGLFGLLSIIIGLVLAFCWVCIFSKRFHDAGQSGWMTVGAILVAIVLSVVVGLVLNPIFGGAVYTDFASMQAMSSGMILKNMITSVIINGALGYYMFKLKPVML
jgi:uncharacterized membrane protein YhaH (DUF805 family)